MFQQLPIILDDDDMNGERVREQCMMNIRMAAAQRWHTICTLPASSKRDDLWQQMDAFLTALKIHFEPVSFFKPPTDLDTVTEQSPEKPSSSDTCCSPTPSTSTASSLGSEHGSSFQWRFLDFSGHVWATLKALLKKYKLVDY